MATGPKSKSKPKTVSRKARPAPADGAASAFFRGAAGPRTRADPEGRVRGAALRPEPGGILERWYVTIADGNITVGHRGGRADLVVKVDRALLDRIAEGTENAMAAQLREHSWPMVICTS